ncbi:MAG TPA: hypothetical protein VHE53_03005, partial [Patescibacteria group bacterium]|nr:hypothetical protein [Patescibacteria group bacterium]
DWGNRFPRKYEVGNIYFLKKSLTFKKIPLDKTSALKRLLESTRIIGKNSVKHLMKFTNEFDNFYYLYFSKNKKELIKFYEKN